MKNKKAFTLVELLGVLLILAILVSIGFLLFSNVTDESKVVVNKITDESINASAISYVKEFKMNDIYWYDEEDEEQSGNQFTCTTIKQLINKGYLKNNLVDAETGEKIDETVTIKVSRDANKVLLGNAIINSEDCDNSPPTAEITFTGTTAKDIMILFGILIEMMLL